MVTHFMACADFTDLCEDADMLGVVEYLYGSVHTELPEEWVPPIRTILRGGNC